MTTQGRRVIVADDEMMMRQVLKVILTEGGFEIVAEATNGLEVISKCQQLKPDLLCLDINMPKKNGIEALQELRESLPNLQVVMISGDASTDKVKEAISLGARGFILKPFNAQQVLTRLVQLFGEAPKQN
ncbi:MAG: response regulator [Gammaproteobacteria bacterium]|nr:response regulator [Gammaproteobacteria bacterium]